MGWETIGELVGEHRFPETARRERRLLEAACVLSCAGTVFGLWFLVDRSDRLPWSATLFVICGIVAVATGRGAVSARRFRHVAVTLEAISYVATDVVETIPYPALARVTYGADGRILMLEYVRDGLERRRALPSDRAFTERFVALCRQAGVEVTEATTPD